MLEFGAAVIIFHFQGNQHPLVSLEYLRRDVITSPGCDETMLLRQKLTAIRHAGKKRGRRTKINQENVSVRLEDKIVRFDISVPVSERVHTCESQAYLCTKPCE